MSEPQPVSFEIAKMMVTVYLTPLSNFRTDSVQRLAETLQEVAVNTRHAEATVKAFTQNCPTPQEVIDTAFALREKFELPKPSQIDQWKEAGYTRDPDWSTKLAEQLATRVRGTGELTNDELMWQAIKKELKVAEFANVPIGRCWDAADTLGLPLNAAQREKRDAWLRIQPKTQGDVK